MMEVVVSDLQDLGIGDSVFIRAVAQHKVEARKQWLSEAEKLPGSYSVRYVTGGVEARRVA